MKYPPMPLAMLALSLALFSANSHAQTGPIDFASAMVTISEVSGVHQLRVLVRDAETTAWYGGHTYNVAFTGTITASGEYDQWTRLSPESEDMLNAFAGADEDPLAYTGASQSLTLHGVTQIDGFGIEVLGPGTGPVSISGVEFRATPFATSGPLLPIGNFFPYDYTVDGDFTPDGFVRPGGPRPETIMPCFLDDTRTFLEGEAWGGYAAAGDHVQVTTAPTLRFRSSVATSYIYTLFGQGVLGGDYETIGFTNAEANFVCEYTTYLVVSDTGIDCLGCPSIGANCAEQVHAAHIDSYVIPSGFGNKAHAKSTPPIGDIIDGTVADVGPQGYTLGVGVTLLTIGISYPDADNDGIVDGTEIPEDQLVLFRVDPQSGDVTVLPSTPDYTLNTIDADTDTLGVFGLAASPAWSPESQMPLPAAAPGTLLALTLLATRALKKHRRHP